MLREILNLPLFVQFLGLVTSYISLTSQPSQGAEQNNEGF